MLSLHLSSTFVTFLCCREPSINFCLHYVQPLDLPSTSVYFPYGCGTLRQLPSISGSCRTFRQILCSLGNCHQLSMLSQDLLSTSATFLCYWGTSVNFRKLAVWLRELPSVSVNFLCTHGTFHQLPSLFRTGGGPSINFRRLSMWL